MSKPRDEMYRLSEALAEVMDDIGVNDRLVMKRRQTMLLNEAIANSSALSRTAKVYHFGSQSEGSTTLGLESDIDISLCLNENNAIQYMSKWKYEGLNKIMVQNEDIPPGYCYLQDIRSDVPLVLSDRLMNYVMDTEGRVLLTNTSMNDSLFRYPVNRTVNGPALTYREEPDRYESDIALYCGSFPYQALSSLQINRLGKWPTEEVLKVCRNVGCFVEPIGSNVHSPDELESKLEWRISTSLQERYLMFSLNITQMMCYILMKMILKTHINPFVEDLLSSFMCKNMLLHYIANISHDLHTGNLLSSILVYIFMLKECVRQRNVPHFIIPEKNLLAVRMTEMQRATLLKVINNLMVNFEQLLFAIEIDDLGRKLMMKLTMKLYSPYSPYIRSASRNMSSGVSFRMVYIIAGMQCVYLNQVLNEIQHASCEEAYQHMSQLYSTLQIYSGEVNCELLIPMVSSTLGSVLANMDINTHTAISDQAFSYLEAGKGSDALSGTLKLVSVLYCTGDMEKAERELTVLQMQYNIQKVLTKCNCHETIPSILGQRLGNSSVYKYYTEHTIKSSIAFCTTFLQCEINVVPLELRCELLRSYNGEVRHLRTTDDYTWMDLIVVDSIPYMYFLQYKTYGHLQKRNKQLQALNNFAQSVALEPNLAHRETSLNLLGQCLEQENKHHTALKCYIASLQHRMRNNAARFLLCMQLFKLQKRDNTKRIHTVDKWDYRLTNQNLVQLRWLLTDVGTSVLQNCFDDLVCNDFAGYLASYETEKIKLQWLFDTRRISKRHETLLSELDRTTLSSNDESSNQTNLLPSYQTSSSYSVDNSEKMFSSAKSSKFDIALLTVLLKYVCGLHAPNDDVWKKPLPDDMSIEADISRLGECRNKIREWDSCEDGVNDERIDEQRNTLYEILTRLGLNVEIRDDIEFDEYLDKLHKHMLEEWYENDQKDVIFEKELPMFFTDADDDAWTKDEETVSKLLCEGKLPNTKQISMICKRYQSNPSIVRKVCGYICNTLQMTSKHIKRCWPAYVYDKDQEANSNSVTFVVVKGTENKLNLDKKVGYNINVYEHFKDSHSAESEEMMSHDMKKTKRFNNKLEKCLRKHSLSLMRSHSNITLIAGSNVKSIGYAQKGNQEGENQRIIFKPCIVIYVQKKGYIPLAEMPFPTTLDEFETDVRECIVSLYSNSEAYQKHENILMGTSVGIKRLSKPGTLGGFLEHPVHKLCGLTCAHVVLNKHELNGFSGYHHHTGKNRKVVQPATNDGEEIGEVACTLVKQDEPVGIDLALVKIQARPPISGKFAITESCQNKYNSGNTMHWKNIQRGAKLIKYGSETGYTEADYQFLGTCTFRNDYGVLLPYQLMIANHIKPLQCDKIADALTSPIGHFAAAGDSGALCFVEDAQGLHAVGVIVGGSGDLKTCYLTPIQDILDALNENEQGTVSMTTFPDHEPMEH